MLSRYSDLPPAGPQAIPPVEQNLIMHAELPIVGGHVLMATDMLSSMGQETRVGNNTTLCLEADSREDADHLYGGLSEAAQKHPRWPTCRGARTGVSSSTATASAG